MQGRPRKLVDVGLAYALASGCTIAEAANALNVSQDTVYRRKKDPKFLKLVNDAALELRSVAAGRLAKIGRDAVDTLNDLLDDELPSVRLGAARAILEHLPKIDEAVLINERLKALEEKFNANHQPATPEPGTNGEAVPIRPPAEPEPVQD